MESAWKSLPTASTLASASTLTTSTSLFESSTCSSQTTSIQVVSFDTCLFSWSAFKSRLRHLPPSHDRGRRARVSVRPSVCEGPLSTGKAMGARPLKNAAAAAGRKKRSRSLLPPSVFRLPAFFAGQSEPKGRREQKRGQKRRKHLSTVHMVCLKRGEARMDFQPR